MFPSSSSVKCNTDNSFCKRVIKHMSSVYRFILNFLCLEKIFLIYVTIQHLFLNRTVSSVDNK